MNPSLYKQHRQRFDHWVVNEFEGIETVNNLSFTAAAKQNSEQSKTRDHRGQENIHTQALYSPNKPYQGKIMLLNRIEATSGM